MWQKSNGDKFALMFHSPKSWADEMYARLISLGCSTRYAKKVADGYRSAQLQEFETE